MVSGAQLLLECLMLHRVLFSPIWSNETHTSSFLCCIEWPVSFFFPFNGCKLHAFYSNDKWPMFYPCSMIKWSPPYIIRLVSCFCGSWAYWLFKTAITFDLPTRVNLYVTCVPVPEKPVMLLSQRWQMMGILKVEKKTK